MPKKLRDSTKLRACATETGVKFIAKIIADSGKSRRQFADEMGEDHQKLTYYIREAKAMRRFLVFLCAIRKKSRLSWSKFGKMLDEEFGD